jgi:hypothetical protein
MSRSTPFRSNVQRLHTAPNCIRGVVESNYLQTTCTVLRSTCQCRKHTPYCRHVLVFINSQNEGTGLWDRPRKYSCNAIMTLR